ncbi:hypothetical protein SLEP1_g16938 [Rubroshorea leprosula]|uniref:Uncharacterized protein n=1 Tax=Rubroshorea leprosula TaxID=152421 RepID=A0AAV5J1R5_9ROSI|nr:hypothetical protein SLEP1_g16938 [Rubroshorea leprosula]
MASTSQKKQYELRSMEIWITDRCYTPLLLLFHLINNSVFDAPPI